MISDWRGDRVIGPTPFWERVRDPLRFALISVLVLLATSIFVALIKGWGEQWPLTTYTRVGCAVFAIQVAPVTIVGLLGPNKGRGVALGLIGGGLAILAWYWGLDVLMALGIVEILPVTPVTP